MVPVSCPPCPASMTTRCSFNPRLRTSERVPSLLALAGTMTLASAGGEAAGAVPAAGATAVVAGLVPGLVSAGLLSGFSGDFLDALAEVAVGFAATFEISEFAVAAGAGAGAVVTGVEAAAKA